MTRENKLALVLGFGLMLFVGILVSDHLAARQAPPIAAVATTHQDVGVPPMPGPGSGGDIVHVAGGQAKQLPAPPQPGPSANTSGGTDGTPDELHADGGSTPSGASERPRLPKAEETARSCVVADGETFAEIAARVYGRRELGQALADFNGVMPNRLRAGATIQLPALALLDPSAAPGESPAVTGSPESAQSRFRFYKVREGDTLYRIAQRELGKGDRWKELEASNADVIKNAADLTPGMQIKIPVLTASAQRSTDA